MHQKTLIVIFISLLSGCAAVSTTQRPDSYYSKSYTAEAILLDTRTGIVPFTALASNSFTAEKNKQDINFNETVRKAELKAIDEDMGEIAERLVQFLAAAPNR